MLFIPPSFYSFYYFCCNNSKSKLEHPYFRTRWFSNLLHLRNTIKVNVLYKTVTLQKAFLSTNTVLILLRNLEKHAKQVFLFENYSPRMLSGLFHVETSFSAAVIITTSWIDPASKSHKVDYEKNPLEACLVISTGLSKTFLSTWTHPNLTQDTPQVFVYKPMSELCG